MNNELPSLADHTEDGSQYGVAEIYIMNLNYHSVLCVVLSDAWCNI